MFMINWRPDVKDEVELQKAIRELYKAMQLVMSVQMEWECFMPPYIHIGD